MSNLHPAEATAAAQAIPDIPEHPATEFGVVIGGTLDPRPQAPETVPHVVASDLPGIGTIVGEPAGDAAVPEPDAGRRGQSVGATGEREPSRDGEPGQAGEGARQVARADAADESGRTSGRPSSTDVDDVAWLNAAERRAWVNLTGIIVKLPGMLDSQLGRESGLSFFEYMVLVSLSEAPGHILRMSQLAYLTSGSLSRLSHVAKRLERDGLIAREPDPLDRRATNAVLTEAGLAKVVDAAPGHVASVRAMIFDHLDEEQVNELGRIASIILDVIDPEGNISAPGVR